MARDIVKINAKRKVRAMRIRVPNRMVGLIPSRLLVFAILVLASVWNKLAQPNDGCPISKYIRHLKKKSEPLTKFACSPLNMIAKGH